MNDFGWRSYAAILLSITVFHGTHSALPPADIFYSSINMPLTLQCLVQTDHTSTEAYLR
jgi:hypothetical protein